mmetsp:Transcript_169/g.538  ORF Transcript_169/g.538 Transcript_169/m.538 type:complete len:422 (+) Transcript_169:677-1942(+)
MLALRQLLVQTPEHLHNTQGGRAHRIRKVTTGGGHSSDDRHRANTLGVASALDLAGTLVERSQAGSQVRRITGIGRHLSKTTRNLTKSLGPSRRRVSHHGHIVAHVAQILGQGDTGVDGSLTSSHRHVGSVRDQGGALHDRLLLALESHGELRELHQHLSHLVTTLTATDVDNSVRVGIFGQGLRDHSLSAAESARNSAGTTQHRGEQSIQHTLASQQRVVTSKLLSARARRAHRPVLKHSVAGLLATELNLNDIIIQCVLSAPCQPSNTAHSLGEQHDLVLDHDVLLDLTENVSTSDLVADLEVDRHIVPAVRAVEGRDVDTTRNVHTLAHVRDALKRALNTVKNLTHQARAKLHGQRLARADHGVTHGQTGGLLVHLDGGRISLKTNDLTDQIVRTYAHQLVHRSAGHLVGNDDRTGHT